MEYKKKVWIQYKIKVVPKNKESLKYTIKSVKKGNVETVTKWLWDTYKEIEIIYVK